MYCSFSVYTTGYSYFIQAGAIGVTLIPLTPIFYFLFLNSIVFVLWSCRCICHLCSIAPVFMNRYHYSCCWLSVYFHVVCIFWQCYCCEYVQLPKPVPQHSSLCTLVFLYYYWLLFGYLSNLYLCLYGTNKNLFYVIFCVIYLWIWLNVSCFFFLHIYSSHKMLNDALGMCPFIYLFLIH